MLMQQNRLIFSILNYGANLHMLTKVMLIFASHFFANSRFNDHAPLAHYDPIEVDLVQMYGDHFYAAKSKDLYPGNDSEVSNAFFFKACHSGLEIWAQEKMFKGYFSKKKK